MHQLQCTEDEYGEDAENAEDANDADPDCVSPPGDQGPGLPL